MGLLDVARQYLDDAAPGGLLNPEWSPERVDIAKGLLSLAPVAGDAVSAYDAIQSARTGQWGDAALNAVGLLPLVPSLGIGGMAIDPKAKARLIADLVAGKGSGTYRLGDVTPGQQKALGQLFNSQVGADVLMTDRATKHLFDGRITQDGFTPEQVGKFAEQALHPRSRADLNVSKSMQNPALLNQGLLDVQSGSRYSSRMPFALSDDGLLKVRSVVPEGLRKKKGPAK